MAEDLLSFGCFDDTGMVSCNICGWQDYGFNQWHMESMLRDHLHKMHALSFIRKHKEDGTSSEVD